MRWFILFTTLLSSDNTKAVCKPINNLKCVCNLSTQFVLCTEYSQWHSTSLRLQNKNMSYIFEWLQSVTKTFIFKNEFVPLPQLPFCGSSQQEHHVWLVLWKNSKRRSRFWFWYHSQILKTGYFRVESAEHWENQYSKLTVTVIQLKTYYYYTYIYFILTYHLFMRFHSHIVTKCRLNNRSNSQNMLINSS